MENPIYIGLSRQTALRRQMSMVANNIANMNTNAFKKELMIYKAHTQKTPFTQKMDFVIDRGTATDFQQGGFIKTENVFDIAINGPGFFQIDDGTGTKYTRNGSFTLDEFNRLVTHHGHPVLDVQGNPILIPEGGEGLEVETEGVLRMNDQQIARLGIVEFDDLRLVAKDRDSLFKTDQPANPAENSTVFQGMLEGSNVNAIVEMTSMLEVHRAYEAVKNLLDREDKRQETIIQRLARPMQGF